MIREHNRSDIAEPRVLKVRLPTEMHLRLHSLKILTGKSISEAVEDALKSYFAHLPGHAVPQGRPESVTADGPSNH